MHRIVDNMGRGRKTSKGKRLAWAVLFLAGLSSCAVSRDEATQRILDPAEFAPYIESFEQTERELYPSAVVAGQPWRWTLENLPLFECPDEDLQRTYYFRWWTYGKHIKPTAEGYVITEFLPDVPWAGKLNTISCAAGHHFYDGRWIRDRRYLDDYSVFWFRKGGEPRRYSFWVADAMWARYLVDGNRETLVDLLPDLVANYESWENTHRDANGLYWQIDDRDGMEYSAGGSGYRPTINSYQYGDAIAIAKIADLAGEEETAAAYVKKAEILRQLVETLLWDEDGQFYKTLPRGENQRLVQVRELIGYVPWYFHLPAPGREDAWRQLLDKDGFRAPFGPTTTEQRAPGFMAKHDHECLWNGPSWPFATSQTLKAMANLVRDYDQNVVTSTDYVEALQIYARSHRLRVAGNRNVAWIDENLHPETGEWIARSILQASERDDKDRGRYYNHSSFTDLIISGLVGLRPRADDMIEVYPLAPADWDYFCLEGIPYHGHDLTILWDRNGSRYDRGQGLRLLIDGREAAARPRLEPMTASIQ